MTSYNEFLETKAHSEDNYGFNPHFLPDCLYDFQKSLVEWSVRKGCAAIFADCGLGKTVMQLVFAQNTIEKINKPALIVTPLSVNHQTVKEGVKFNIEVNRSTDGKPAKNITVTNYEKLHLFNPDDYGTVVLDESSAIKNFDGKRRLIVTDFIRKIPYRLLCTATAAPNDYIELGTSAEVLSVMGRMNMLSTFFINDENSNHPIWWGARWRFKKHAENRFWRWICSWARAVKKPSDIGFSDEGYILPPLEIDQTVIKCDDKLDGMLFKMPAVTLNEQREERKKTLQERCEKVYEKVQVHKRSVVWCHLNAEGDLLEKLIPNSKQVKGSQKDEQKEEILNAFSDGELPVIITKPKIGAWGLNWQHCNHMTFFPSHSFEQFYQGVRRCWRFGQTNPVTVDIVTSEGESGVMKNLERKAEAAQKMFEMMVGFMNDAIKINDMTNYDKKVRLPNWL